MCDRTCRMDGFSLSRAGELALKNCKDLKRIMLWNTEHGVKMFRITSCLFPFMDHPTLGYKVEDLYESAEILKVLRETGEIAKLHDIRLSCHPGPFTTLASPNEENVKKTLLGLDMHDNIGNMLGLGEEFVINIHVGGSYDSKIKTAARFVHNFQRLNPSLKKRITLENDDKGGGWSITELRRLISEKTGTKLVLDVHHHRFRSDESLPEAARIAFETWEGFVDPPKIHYSESAEGKMPTAHSDYVTGPIPSLNTNLSYDVMLEVKAKDKAYLKVRENLCEEGEING